MIPWDRKCCFVKQLINSSSSGKHSDTDSSFPLPNKRSRKKKQSLFLSAKKRYSPYVDVGVGRKGLHCGELGCSPPVVYRKMNLRVCVASLIATMCLHQRKAKGLMMSLRKKRMIMTWAMQACWKTVTHLIKQDWNPLTVPRSLLLTKAAKREMEKEKESPIAKKNKIWVEVKTKQSYNFGGWVEG